MAGKRGREGRREEGQRRGSREERAEQGRGGLARREEEDRERK